MSKRYVHASSDMFVWFKDEDDLSKGTLDSSHLDFCSDCGSIVYRQDLHDNWHDKMERTYRNASLLDTIG